MDLIEKSKEKYKQLFGDGLHAAYATDPDFQDILSRFIIGEVFYQGSLDDKKRELITLVVLATKSNLASAHGDFYTRGALDLKTRELLTCASLVHWAVVKAK